MVSQITINGNEVSNIVSAEFNDTLNDINKAEINITGQDAFEKSLAVIDNILEVTSFNKNYKYKIVNEGLTEDNSIKLVCRGIEEIAVNTDIDVSLLSNATTTTNRAGIYSSVDIQDIFTDLASHLSGWTIDSSLSTTISEFRLNDSESVWNGLAKLANQEGLEIDVDYDNQEFLVETNLGSNRVDTLNEKIDFEGIPSYTRKRAKAKKVFVYGRADGDFQVRASAQDAGYSAGDPTFKVEDPNIISETQAQKRADVELAKLKTNIEHYIIPQVRGKTYSVSDTLIVNSPSIGLDNKELKIVRLITSIRGDEVIQSVEVTNAEYSRAFKSRTQELSEEMLKVRENITTEQGSGNTQNYAGVEIGNDTFPLVIAFNFSNDNYDSANTNFEIKSFTLDYDIDPFRQTAGGITPTGVDPQVFGDSGFTQPDVENDTGLDDIDTDSAYNSDISTSGADFTFNTSVPGVLGTGVDYTIFTVSAYRERPTPASDNGYDIRVRNTTSGGIYIFREIMVMENTYVETFVVNGDIEGDNIEVRGRSLGPSDLYSMTISICPVSEHIHPPDNMNAQNHPHGDGDYEVRDNDVANSITIGDTVDDSGSVNATGISWELRYWNGTSYVLKNSGSETFPAGQTFNRGIDLSDSGTYPDAFGNWAVFLYTNASQGDTLKGKVNIKHNLKD